MGFWDIAPWVGGAFSAGATIIPGLQAGADVLAGEQERKANEEYNALQRGIANDNIGLQKEFATHGIRWKVADAKAAGIHPLYALGANTQGFTPVSVGTVPDYSGANTTRAMGQNINRAVSSMMSKQEVSEQQAQMNALQIENQQLQNDMLRSQLAQRNSTQQPGLPSNSQMGSLTRSGQGDAYVLEKPLTVTHTARGAPSQEVGKIPDVAWSQTATGLVPVPAGEVTERMEDQIIPSTAWGIRNYLLPDPQGKMKPSKDLLPKGANDWSWNPYKMEYQPVYSKEKRSYNSDEWSNKSGW